MEELIKKLQKLSHEQHLLDEKINKLDKTFEKYKNDEILVKLTLEELEVINGAFASWEYNADNHLIYYEEYKVWIKLNNILLKMLEKRGGEK